MKLGIETATILTLSRAHLHPTTISAILNEKGDISEGPSIGVREEGFLVPTGLGDPTALDLDVTGGLFPSLNDRFPDLTIIRAIARGQGAEWVNLDDEGVVCSDILPVYDGSAPLALPGHPLWNGGCLRWISRPGHCDIAQASFETLELLGPIGAESSRNLDDSPGM